MTAVVSLVPSVTETLVAWGVDPVACTRFCEQPTLEHVGGTKDPDIEAIVGLRPDLVVMDEEENRREDAEALLAAGVPVHVLAVRSVDGVRPALTELSAAVGVEPMVTEPAPVRPIGLRVFVPIWRRPWMTLSADTYGSSLLQRLGVTNVFGAAAVRYPTVTLEQAREHAPDLVLAPSEPYPFTERQRPELEQVAPVVLVDGKDLFWWGVRTAPAAERLSRFLKEHVASP